MHPSAVEVTHKAMENIGPNTGERPGLTSGGSSAFDAPGEQTRFGAQDVGRGAAGKPGAAFDGPWDRPEKTPAARREFILNTGTTCTFELSVTRDCVQPCKSL